MTALNIKAVVNLMLDNLLPGENLMLSIGGIPDHNRLSILNAPSSVIEAIHDNGYSLEQNLGALRVTVEED